MKDDKELIQKCAEGSQRHQTILYNRYYRTMEKLIYKYIDCPTLSQEIINDGFTRIFRKITQFNFDGSFEGWMRRIMFHALSNAVKSDERVSGGKTNLRKGFHRNILYDSNNESRDDMFIIHPDLSYDYYKIVEAIDSVLPTNTAKVFKMHLEGFKHEEIAAELNISAGTSKWHVSEARSIIREKVFNNKY